MVDEVVFGRKDEDFGLAGWLADELGREWRYDHTAKRWHHWDGTRWAPDSQGKVFYAVAASARRALTRGTWAAGASELGEDGVKRMMRLLKVASQQKVLEALATFPGYGTNGDDWDSVPFTLGVKNGIVDLTENRLIASPTSDNLVTKTTGVAFFPIDNPSEFEDRAPQFMRVMSEWMSGDESMVAFLLLWFGASMFGFSPEQRFLLMVGIGRNGKGALKHSVMHAVGEYGEQFDANLYMKTKYGAARSDGARADLMALKGKRITFFSDPESNRFNEEMLKAHTGGDRITARALYSNNVQSWDPTHSISFLVNNPPEVEDIGPSMAARVMVADFRERYDGEKEDKELYPKLAAEAEGILAILCWAAAAWYRSWKGGHGGIVLPERVVEQSRRFMERNDPVAQALDAVFKTGQGLTGQAQLVYDAYRDWHNAAEDDVDLMSMVKFASALEKKGFHKIRRNNGLHWVGLAPLSAIDLADRGYGDE